MALTCWGKSERDKLNWAGLPHSFWEDVFTYLDDSSLLSFIIVFGPQRDVVWKAKLERRFPGTKIDYRGLYYLSSKGRSLYGYEDDFLHNRPVIVYPHHTVQEIMVVIRKELKLNNGYIKIFGGKHYYHRVEVRRGKITSTTNPRPAPLTSPFIYITHYTYSDHDI